MRTLYRRTGEGFFKSSHWACLFALFLFAALMSARWVPSYGQRAYPSWADSWDGVHSFLNGNPAANLADAYVQTLARRFDFGLGSIRYGAALRKGNPSFIDSIRVNAFQSATHNLAWFQANHPEWLLYDCDRNTAVVPDFTNPDYVNFKWNTEFVPAMRGAGPFAQALVLDFAHLENEFQSEATLGRCVQKFRGTASPVDVSDPSFTDGVIAYLFEIRRRVHAVSPSLLLIANTYPRVV
jgi:hypothetical protein